MRNNKIPDELSKAKKYALLLIKFRLRSEKELAERLKKKDFSQQAIQETIESLKNNGIIDDRAFAAAWIKSRIKKPLSLNKLKQELLSKGINKQIIESYLETIKKEYSEETAIQNIIDIQLSKEKHRNDPNAKNRIYAYLIRHGYSPETVTEILNQQDI